MHRLVILAGNPGSGKTSVAAFLEAHGFTHLAVDDFYRKAPRNPAIEDWSKDQEYVDTAYTLFRNEIFRRLANQEQVVVEVSGARGRWQKIFDELNEKYPQELISFYLDVSRETAGQRIHARNETDYHFKIDDERLNIFFKSSEGVADLYQHVIDANRPLANVMSDIDALL